MIGGRSGLSTRIGGGYKPEADEGQVMSALSMIGGEIDEARKAGAQAQRDRLAWRAKTQRSFVAAALKELRDSSNRTPAEQAARQRSHADGPADEFEYGHVSRLLGGMADGDLEKWAKANFIDAPPQVKPPRLPSNHRRFVLECSVDANDRVRTFGSRLAMRLHQAERLGHIEEAR